jgi:hypothetical protein
MQSKKRVLFALRVEKITVFRYATFLLPPQVAGDVQSSRFSVEL